MSQKQQPSVPSSNPSTSKSAATTAKRVTANRKNAQKSTGPRTESGKARVSQNAVKHGMYSASAFEILFSPDNADDRAEFDELLAGMRAALRPEGKMEDALVDRLVAQHLRLKWLQETRDTYLTTDNEDDKWWRTKGRVEEAIPCTLEEGRTSRDISKLIRDLEFLQRWRLRLHSAPPPRAPEPAPRLDIPQHDAPAPRQEAAPATEAPQAKTVPESAAEAAPQPIPSARVPKPHQPVVSESQEQSQKLFAILGQVDSWSRGLP